MFQFLPDKIASPKKSKAKSEKIDPKKDGIKLSEFNDIQTVINPHFRDLPKHHPLHLSKFQERNDGIWITDPRLSESHQHSFNIFERLVMVNALQLLGPEKRLKPPGTSGVLNPEFSTYHMPNTRKRDINDNVGVSQYMRCSQFVYFVLKASGANVDWMISHKNEKKSPDSANYFRSSAIQDSISPLNDIHDDIMNGKMQLRPGDIIIEGKIANGEYSTGSSAQHVRLHVGEYFASNSLGQHDIGGNSTLSIRNIVQTSIDHPKIFGGWFINVDVMNDHYRKKERKWMRVFRLKMNL